MLLAYPRLARACCVTVFALVPPLASAANDPAKPGTTAQTPQSTAAASKATRCAELKKRIDAFEAAKAKGTKGAGEETIKQDIAWYRDNCLK